uniref:C2 domain-containing protein n=1 Tax=Romanomermis culicivorax TaxID=13658 RepID=A0A915IN47_ROMCU
MTSFSRSEEVRTPSQLQAQASLIQQLSVDSTGIETALSQDVQCQVLADLWIKSETLRKKIDEKLAPFVKLYLMDGKRCVAKAKSATAARIAEPHFDQHLIFEESHKGRYLQLSVWGDYGRMERKCFMGIALLKLDDIDFTGAVEGWYKLYHTNSLIGLSNRMDSDASTIRGSQEIDKII